jgi:hypothetical protein
MNLVRALFCLIPMLVSGFVFAAPGYEWEMKMEMEGMPFPMPAQKACTPQASREPPVTREDRECKILDKKMSGNRFQWKAQCKDGTMVGDITSTPTSYSGTMKMTDNSGATTSMKMSGKRLGECDYQDKSGQVAAGVKQGEEAKRKVCADALEHMQGSLFSATECASEKPAFCAKAQTLPGFVKLTDRMGSAQLEDPQIDKALGLDNCSLSVKKLRPKMCTTALGAGNLGFITRLCPTEQAALVKQHCEGRKYSSQIDAKYQDFCARAASGRDGSDSKASDSGGVSKPGTAPASGMPGMPAMPTDVQQGLKALKGLFGQ